MNVTWKLFILNKNITLIKVLSQHQRLQEDKIYKNDSKSCAVEKDSTYYIETYIEKFDTEITVFSLLYCNYLFEVFYICEVFSVKGRSSQSTIYGHH